ncbi:MAG: hypothetical protein FWC72_00015 [Oscillospiraceae bacterium]|nr:hypothetical protein [Oscillospiraceae bacterium]
MKKQFQSYLEKQGYSVVTPAGNPSTVYDYIKRIDKVCEWEHTTWAGLAQNIHSVITQYDLGGLKESLGNKSHRAVINALKRFSEFLAY